MMLLVVVLFVIVSHRRVSAMPVAGGKLQCDEVFQEIKRSVDAVSLIV